VEEAHQPERWIAAREAVAGEQAAIVQAPVAEEIALATAA